MTFPVTFEGETWEEFGGGSKGFIPGVRVLFVPYVDE